MGQLDAMHNLMVGWREWIPMRLIGNQIVFCGEFVDGESSQVLLLVTIV